MEFALVAGLYPDLLSGVVPSGVCFYPVPVFDSVAFNSKKLPFPFTEGIIS
jgi:hypothetical protein